ncbi:hypothetical protein UlMin_039371 [Ulmus minor]
METLGYVHSDLWGPSQKESLGGGKYFISFIDDCSRKVWVFILKNKSDAFGKFKEWKKMVEVQTGKKLKKLRTDNGLEFLNYEFDQFCKDEGIVRHKTVPYTPQQNGLAERMNRTLLERVRCMLLEGGVPKRFWGEAVNTAAYLVNRCPSSALDFKTPEEVWTGHPPKFDNLRVFGCVAYAHQKQGKLDARAKKCMFVGYPEGVKGYKLWNEEGGSSKCIISRDVVFRETEYYWAKATQKESGEDDMGRNHGRERAEIEVEPLEVTSTETGEDMTHEEGSLEVEDQGDGLESYQLTRDRIRRPRKAPERYGYADLVSYALFASEELDDSEPKSYKQAMASQYKKLWAQAMKEEMDSLDKNLTWIYSPVVKHTSIRVLLAFVTKYNLELEQMDVKTAFLHGNLEERILMAQPEGFVKKGDEGKWIEEGLGVFLLLYVDDMLIASKDKEEIRKLKRQLGNEFEMKDLGPAKKILGMEIIRDRKQGTLFVSQCGYLRKVLAKFGMSDSKAVQTPLAAHFKLSTDMSPKTDEERKDVERIPYASVDHWEAVKWIFRYVKGASDVGLLYKRCESASAKLVGYVDADFAGDLDKRRSLTGYVFTLFGCTVSWKAQLQPVVALSTTEAEYIAATEGVKEAMWLKGLVGELGCVHDKVEVFCDNQSSIHLTKNQMFHERTKHIDIKLHFIRDVVSRGIVTVEKIHTDENPADMLTKPVTGDKFKLCLNLLSATALSI